MIKVYDSDESVINPEVTSVHTRAYIFNIAAKRTLNPGYAVK